MADNTLNSACQMEMRSRGKTKKPALTRPDTPPGSPSTNCAICLGVCDNKSYSDTCFHQFCFNCLLTWSQVKAECPLCKQRFNKIIYNIKSDREYDEHRVEQRTFIDDDDDISILQNSAFAAINTSQRFRYRTTLTLERRHQNALEELLRSIPSALTTHEVLTGRAFHHGEAARTLGFLEVDSRRPFAHAPGFGRTRSATNVRRTIYERGLYAYPLPDLTGRFRESSPEFYRFNPTQIHRLVPWLSREITAILPSSSNVAYIISTITDMLPEHSISSHFFANVLRPFFNEYTEHFAHEFSVFASTPYDITGYDRAVQYRHVDVMSEIVSDSDSRDSDIIEVPNPEPSHSAVVRPGQSAIEDVITIETIDNSDTDDSASEVMVVGYIKPPEQRTPPVVDLVASDSDVILQEDAEPSGAPVYSTELSGEGSSGPLVKLSLRRKRPQIDDSDSDWNSAETPSRRKKKGQTRTLRSFTESMQGDKSNNEYSSQHSSSPSSEWTSSASGEAEGSNSSSDDSTVAHLPPRLRYKMKHKTSFSSSLPKSSTCSSACERRSSCRNCNTTRKRSSKISIQNGKEKCAKRSRRSDSTSGKRKRRANGSSDSTDSYYTAESLGRKKGKKKEKKCSKDKVNTHKKSESKSTKSKEKKQRASFHSAEYNNAGPSHSAWLSCGAAGSSHVKLGASCSASAPSSSARFLDNASPSCSEDDSPKIKSVISVVAPWTAKTELQPSCSVPKTSLSKVSQAEDAPAFPVKCESLLDIMNTAVLNPSNGVLACQSSSDSAPVATSRLDHSVLSQVFTALVHSSNDIETKPLNLSFKKEN